MNTIADNTVDPEQCGGRPCIRGMRIRVSDVLDLEPEDLQAALRFASRRLDHPVLVA